MFQITPLMRRLLALMLLTCATWATAQDFPNRPIRLVVPYGPGGVTDINARTLATRLGEILGQSVVVDNRAGGASIVGSDAVAKAKPDGYTLLLTSTALAANHILFKKIPYDPVKDLMPVSFVSTVPTVLVVHTNVPAQNLKELVQLARSKPEAMNYGSAGNGSGNHLTTEVFLNTTGLKVQHIPYKGGGAVMADLVAGQVTFVFAVLPTALRNATRRCQTCPPWPNLGTPASTWPSGWVSLRPQAHPHPSLRNSTTRSTKPSSTPMWWRVSNRWGLTSWADRPALWIPTFDLRSTNGPAWPNK
jgi:hypothetical protein